ncbi:hypothetical protein ACSQ67_012491 [Phaseolus vulgaris]
MQKSGDDRFNASKPKLGTLMSSMASCKPLHLSVNTQRNARHGFLLFLSLLSFDSERGNFGDALTFLIFDALTYSTVIDSSLSLSAFCHQSSNLFLIWIDLMPVLSSGSGISFGIGLVWLCCFGGFGSLNRGVLRSFCTFSVLKVCRV